MAPMATLDDAKVMLRALMDRHEPLAREVPPAPGSRAERYAQLLCPDLHPIEATSEARPTGSAPASPAAGGLADRVVRLETELATVRAALQKLARSIGEPDPLADATIPALSPSQPSQPSQTLDSEV
jgi:uncharacterized protein YceH (UPF0502 family)